MTVQNVITAVSADVRQVLGASGSDATLMIPWVDRIHKDCLHTSFYNNLMQRTTTFVSTPGTVTYTLSPTDIRRILSVYDSTSQRLLMPIASAASPSSMAEQASAVGGGPAEEQTRPKLSLSMKTQSLFPEYYTFTGASGTGISIFPPPYTNTFAGTLIVFYEAQVTDLTGLSDVLVLPSDAKDMIVAGVNMLAHQYLKLDTDATLWGQQYERMKQGQPVV